MRAVLPSFFALALLALGALAATGSRAASTPDATPADPALVEKIREANAECFACHSEAGFRTPPRPDLDLEKLKLLLHDPEQFDASNHAGMECTVCHGQAVKTFPHPPNTRESISECGECHAQKAMRVEGQFDASVHAIRLKDKFTCQTCHDPHIYRVAQKLGEPRKIVAQDNAMCIDCHNSDLRFSAFVENLTPRKARPDLDTLHAWLPNTRLHWQAVRCIECHTPVSAVKSLAMSHEVLPKEEAERNCASCHSQDTALRVRLYRFAQETKLAEYGFVNSAILDSAYVIGATRNATLDRIVIGLFALTVLALLGHGAVRLAAAFVRRRKSS